MNKNKLKLNRGEISFGMEVLLFIIALFVLWVLMGQPKTQNADKPFIQEQTIVQ